jgi:hypothetical protein
MVAARYYEFTGNDPRFTVGKAYRAKEIAERLGCNISAIHARLKHFDVFDDIHLRPVSPAKSTGPNEPAGKARADIIKSCVISETKYLVSKHPEALRSVLAWLKSVANNDNAFWIRLDKLSLEQIITMAVTSGQKASA